MDERKLLARKPQPRTIRAIVQDGMIYVHCGSYDAVRFVKKWGPTFGELSHVRELDGYLQAFKLDTDPQFDMTEVAAWLELGPPEPEDEE